VDPIRGATGRWITAARSANAAASERLLDVSSGSGREARARPPLGQTNEMTIYYL
jgi:hypothetical protein